MATALDNKLRPKVLALIAKYGTLATFLVPSVRNYEPATGKYREAGTRRISVKVSPPDQYNDHFINGDTIRISDMKITIAAKDLSFVPEKGIVVEFSDKTAWSILSVKPMYSGDLVAAFELQLRQ